MTEITRIQVWKKAIKSCAPYHMAGGKTCDSVDSIILLMETNDGLKGWGEVTPIPHYLPAYANGVLPAIKELSPILLGASPIGPEALGKELDRDLIGHPYAKSAIDIALWDITAKKADLPLYSLLGGRQTKQLPLYKSITCAAPDDMADMAATAYRAGLRQFQVKLGVDKDWRHDVERLLRVRDAVGSGPLVYGDWNCCASKLDAIRAARAVSHQDIMIEQPCEIMESCADVRTTSGLPMKLDESVHDLSSLMRGHRLGCMDSAAIKLSKFGGLTKARQARDFCCEIGTKTVIEDTWGGDITTSAFLHLATATDADTLLNTCDLSNYVSSRLDVTGYSVDKGVATVSSRPGIGVSPVLEDLGTPEATMSYT